VAHRGKTQLNVHFRTQQAFPEHNNLFQNTTIFFRTQQSFSEHNNLFQNTTRFSDTQQQTETQPKNGETQQNFKGLITSATAESD